ncbi:hypothetical protein [Streptomyces sp. NPDC051162]|uniref:hypothetical protein n=1 Tax=Streptomyces sp. NPDC051162 TaxID=3154747 RepID=UPI0034235E5F
MDPAVHREFPLASIRLAASARQRGARRSHHGAACTLATSTPASSGQTAQIADQIWKFGAHAAQSGVATVTDANGTVIGALNRQCGPHASSSAPGTAANKAVCTDAGSATGYQVVLVGAVPRADGKTKYIEAITGGANGYDGAGGTAHVTPVSATEYDVTFTGQNIG